MMSKLARWTLLAPLAGAVLVMAGCSGEQEELAQWMEQQRREVKPDVPPLSPPKKFNPQSYSALSGVEPFSTQKLTVALKQEARQPNSFCLRRSIAAESCSRPIRWTV